MLVQNGKIKVVGIKIFKYPKSRDQKINDISCREEKILIIIEPGRGENEHD